MDSEADVASCVRDLLLALDFRSDTAEDEDQAMALLDTNQYELAILDLDLAIGDGFSVLQWMRDHRPFTDVIVLTARSDPESAVRAMRLGVVDFVGKPALSEMIRVHVMRALERRTQPVAFRATTRPPGNNGGLDDLRFDAAASYAFDAMWREDTRAEGMSCLGELYQLQGNLTEARRCYETALTIDGTCATARHALDQLAFVDPRERRQVATDTGRVADLFTPDTMLPSTRSRSADGLIREVSQFIARAHSGIDEREVETALLERERRGSTSIGNGVAIPHAKLAALERPLVCLARSRRGVDFDSPDGSRTRLFFVVLTPARAYREHLRTIAAISRLCGSVEFRTRMVRAHTAEEMHEVLEACGDAV